jgi:hypothetical protein
MSGRLPDCIVGPDALTLRRRIGPGGVEIGYWTARRFLRQRIATTAAGLLTEAAFSDRRSRAWRSITTKPTKPAPARPTSSACDLPEKGSTRSRRPASLASRASGRSASRSGARCEEVGHERRRRHPAAHMSRDRFRSPGCRGPATEQLKPEHNNIEIDDQLRQIDSEAICVREQEFEPTTPGTTPYGGPSHAGSAGGSGGGESPGSGAAAVGPRPPRRHCKRANSRVLGARGAWVCERPAIDPSAPGSAEE